MGKNLKGKELGPGLSQRKDGRYSARFVTSCGKRIEKYLYVHVTDDEKIREIKKFEEYTRKMA